MNIDKIKEQIKRISDNSPHNYEETERMLIRLLEKTEDTGDLMRLLVIYRTLEG